METTQEQINSIALKVVELKQERHKYAQQKINLQSQLAHVKKRFSEVKQGSKEFDQAKRDKAGLKILFQDNESKLSEINQQIKKYNVMHDQAMKMFGGEKRTKGVREELHQLIKKYRSFSKDKTRIASLRVMSNEIADELEEVLINT